MNQKAKLVRQLAEYAATRGKACLISCQPGPGPGDYQEIYLEVEPLAGQRVKLFLLLGLPEGQGPFPAVLHIHGGGQTADPEHVRHWVKAGFAACSYDWTGPAKGREKTSDLGQLAASFTPEAIDPLQSAFLFRLLLAECVLAWLAGQEQVDPARIGAYGISWGGSITWLLNHYDQRLRAAAPIYGCGEHMNPARRYWNNNLLPVSAVKTQAWQEALDGVVLADRQNAPVFMLNGTNDFWGWLDVADLAMARLGPLRGSTFLTANLNHQLDRFAGTSLTAWMKTHLTGADSWPQAPQLQVQAAGTGQLLVLIKPGQASKTVQEVRLNWSFADFCLVAPPARFWHSQSLPASSPEVKIPLPDPELAVFFYADIIYHDQTKISSPLTRVSPLALGCTHPASDLSYYLEPHNFGWHCTNTRTEPFDPEDEFWLMTGPDGQKALAVAETGSFSFSTNKFTDPAWRNSGCRERLSLVCFASVPGSWELQVRFRPDQAGEKTWSCRRDFSGWQDLDLAADDFISSQGKPLPCWSFLQRLTVTFLPKDTSCGDYSTALGQAGWF